MSQIRAYSTADMDFAISRQRERRTGLAKKHFRWFIAETMDNYDFNWHHLRNCKAFMDWYKGITPFLIITEPPRHGKTQQFSIHGPAFIFGDNPEARVISTSYSASLASKNNRAVQRLMSGQRYKNIFPNTRLNEKGSRIIGPQPLLNSEEFEIVNHRGTYRAAGIGGPITGTGADYLLIDDPIKNEEEANSEVYREKIWDWWSSTALTRLEKDGRVLLIMTRWHEDDLAGRLIEQAKSDPNAIQWTVLNFEAIREDMSDKHDPRVHGEPLWPKKYNMKRLKTIETSVGPRWWNALYQQRPTALEGGIIKSAWLKYYTELPPTFHSYLQSWDFTFRDTDGTDYVVGTVWGVYSNQAYLLDMVRSRMDFNDACEALVDLSIKWPKARRKLIEAKANGDAILSAMKRPGLRADGKTIRPAITGLVGMNPEEIGGKSARLTACATDFQAGDVLLPHPSIAPWVGPVVDELVKFPNARYDDIADSVSQALNDIFGRGNLLERLSNL